MVSESTIKFRLNDSLYLHIRCIKARFICMNTFIRIKSLIVRYRKASNIQKCVFRQKERKKDVFFGK